MPVCPDCGRCSRCGHVKTYPYSPYYPANPYYPATPYPQVWGTTTGTITTGLNPEPPKEQGK